MNDVLNSNTLNENEQLTTLEEGLADERDSILTIEDYMNQKSEIEPCQ